MKQTIDLIKIPTGYSHDIQEFCAPVLEVAMMRGEKEGTFDDDFFFEALDKHLSENEQRVILHNAHRFLDNRLYLIGADIPHSYEEEFEAGCLHFIKDFLYINQLKTVIGITSDVWQIKLKLLPGNLWQLSMVSK